jgi:hemerythrin superfamily protein
MRKLMRSKPSDYRVELFTLLRIELASHEAAEERHLYVRMLMDDRGLHASRDALGDHHKMDKIVEKLQVEDHSGRSWMASVKKLSKQLHDHLREEETIFFQLAGKILSDVTKRTAAVKYRRDYKQMQRKLST